MEWESEDETPPEPEWRRGDNIANTDGLYQPVKRFNVYHLDLNAEIDEAKEEYETAVNEMLRGRAFTDFVVGLSKETYKKYMQDLQSRYSYVLNSRGESKVAADEKATTLVKDFVEAPLAFDLDTVYSYWDNKLNENAAKIPLSRQRLESLLNTLKLFRERVLKLPGMTPETPEIQSWDDKYAAYSALITALDAKRLTFEQMKMNFENDHMLFSMSTGETIVTCLRCGKLKI